MKGKNKKRAFGTPAAGAAPPRCHPMTLLEILLATFILLFGIMGVMSLVPLAIHQAADALQKPNAASVARSAKVSLMRGRLELDDNGGTSFKDTLDWDQDNVRIPHPDLDNGTGWIVDDEYIYHNEELDEFFVLADPDNERSYAWRAEMEKLEDPYWQVRLTVYFPPPYRREVYRTTFLIRTP